MATGQGFQALKDNGIDQDEKVSGVSEQHTRVYNCDSKGRLKANNILRPGCDD